MFRLIVKYNLYDHPIGVANKELEEIVGKPHNDSGLVLVQAIIRNKYFLNSYSYLGVQYHKRCNCCDAEDKSEDVLC